MAEATYDPATGEMVGLEPAAPGSYTPMLDELVVPKEPWDRFYLAASLGLRDPELPRRLKAETLAALVDPWNLLALCVILAAWAAASIAGGPVAWTINLGLGALGVYAIAGHVVDLSEHARDYATGAYGAKSSDEIRAAASHFAAALVEVGDLAIMGLFSLAAFRATRALVMKRMKLPQVKRAPQERAPQERAPQERAPQERAPQERAPQERAPQERAPKNRLLKDVAVSAGAKEAADNVKDKVKDVLPTVVGWGLGLVATVLLGAWLLSRRPRRR